MKNLTSKTVYTIGHSTHPIVDFLEMLKYFDVKVLVDIRRLPGSRKYPQFDQDNLKKSLAEAEIEYIYLADLGGRRKVNKDSKNNRWNNPSFRAYADYMETDEFTNGVDELETIAINKTTAFMCSEAVWWRCHRSMVADNLKAKEWNVYHIMGSGKAQEHPYTSPAIVTNHHVSYSDEV